MSDGTDIASTIGTWLAVLLASIALLGVVGPLLLWRAAKSTRNKALNSLEEGGAETYGYVGHGIWTGQRVRLFRKVRAPILTSEPTLPVSNKLTYSTGPQPTHLSTDWVQFGSLLEAYSMIFTRGDPLVIESNRTWLPINSSWLLLVGLVGRYGRWADKGRLAKQIARGTVSTQARVWNFESRSGSSKRRRKPIIERDLEGWQTSLPWKRPSYPWDDSGDRRSLDKMTYRPLYGLTGTLYFPAKKLKNDSEESLKERVFFVRHQKSRVGELCDDELVLGDLFWLAVGCLPLQGAETYCLADVREVSIIARPPEVLDHSSLPPMSLAAHRIGRHDRFRSETVRFSGIDSDESSMESVDHARGVMSQVPSPVAYVTPKAGDRVVRAHIDPGQPRAFCMKPCNDRFEGLSGFATLVHADSPNREVLSLEEIPLSDDDVRDIDEDNRGTFMSRSSEWLRLDDGSANRSHNRFLLRTDGQRLALTALKLRLSPYGYLMPQEQSLCKELLSCAAHTLSQLFTKAIWAVDLSDLGDNDKERLKRAMNNMYTESQDATLGRSYFLAIHELDMTLNQLIHHNSSKDRLISNAVRLSCLQALSFNQSSHNLPGL